MTETDSGGWSRWDDARVLSAYAAITVVYEGDAALLSLQARSVALHADPGVVTEIVVIDNTRRGLGAGAVAELLREYGPLAPRVSVVPARRLLSARVASGWWGQQLLKLVVAEHVTAQRYLVLDAKNVLVHRLDRAFLEDEQGRPRMVVQPYGTHPLLPRLRVSLRWWGIDPEQHVARFGSTVTPFVMVTALVREMVAEAERRSGTTFVRAFRSQDVTEFFFYLGWLHTRGPLTDVYVEGRTRCPAVWPGRPGIAVLRREADESERGGAPVFSVHQKALKDFDAERTGVLADVWVRAGLFSSAEEAAAFVARFQRAWRSPSTRVAVLRSRALGLARRVGQRVDRPLRR